jgi:hypothetical protein
MVGAEAGGAAAASEMATPNLRRLGAHALDVGAVQVSRLGLGTFRGIRSLGSFALRMVIPPLHPGAIVIEAVFFVLSEVITRYAEAKERKNFQKQLNRLPPQLGQLIKAQKEQAAKMLIEAADGILPAFVYARITATVTRKTTDQLGFPLAETWDVNIDRLDWDNWSSNPRAKQPIETEKYRVDPKDLLAAMTASLSKRDVEKATQVVFNVSEPIFTPFDWLLGALQWLEETLLLVYEGQTGVPGGVGPVKAKTDKKFLERYFEIREWLTRQGTMLQQHRAAEELVGTEWVGPVRRSMIFDAYRVVKFLAPKLKALVPADPKKNYYPMFDTTQLASQIQAFLERSKASDHRGYYAEREKPLPAMMTAKEFWTKIGWKGPPI